jgi:hypothetical protein
VHVACTANVLHEIDAIVGKGAVNPLKHPERLT